MAASTAWRIMGSPARATRRLKMPVRLRSSVSRLTMRPVSISAQVEALTNRLSERGTWWAQSVEPILSRIRRSTVSASGMRSSASARHMRTTPSREDRSYSCMKASMPPRRPWPARMAATSWRARAAMRALASSAKLARGMSRSTARLSSMR